MDHGSIRFGLKPFSSKPWCLGLGFAILRHPHYLFSLLIIIFLLHLLLRLLLLFFHLLLLLLLLDDDNGDDDDDDGDVSWSSLFFRGDQCLSPMPGRLLRIFQLSHIVLHSYQSVQCVCVCVCVCVVFSA